MDELSRRFGNHAEVQIEYDIGTEDAFHEADLMISDFSGAAYEYAFGTLRPVLFVDVPHKTRNARWHELGLPTFEDTMRSKVGKVIPPGEVANVQRHATDLLNARATYAQQLESLRASAVYNVGNSAGVGAEIIDHLLGQGETRSTAGPPIADTVQPP
jgi:YidC/Oxa1 family membrane protein insertase